MRHFENAFGRLARIADRGGCTCAELEWDGDALVRLAVPGASVAGAIVRDPLLGEAHVIDFGDRPGTTMSAIDWARPTEIPAIAAPGQLSAGAGGAILNVIAILAVRARVASLRYAGPYPTHELWRTLARSFRTSASEAEFTAHAIERMVRVARDPLPIEFVPAPHERVAVAGGHIELRGGELERAVVCGVAYVRDGSPARLVDRSAELWFGDAVYARIATFDDDAVIDGPHPIPRCTSDVVGKPFPPALVGAIAELVADAAPAPLAADVRVWIGSRAIRWADLGARAARADSDGIAVHAAIWDRIAPFGLGRLALALAEALAPVATIATLAKVRTAQF